MGIIRYESHSGYISHVILEQDLTDVHTMSGGIFKGLVSPGEDVRYGHRMAEIIDPYEGYVKETILARQMVSYFLLIQIRLSQKETLFIS